MNIKILGLTIGLAFTTLSAWATAPTGNDNQGGVAAPAGTYGANPGVPLVGLNPYTANATRVVNDLFAASISEVGLGFTRYYNSRSIPPVYSSQIIGNSGSWSHTYQWTFTSTTVNGVPTIQVTYPNGIYNSFTQTSTNVWTSSSAVTDVITPQGTGYVLTASSNVKYVFSNETLYNNSGYYLTSIIDSKGLTTTLSYTSKTTVVPDTRTTTVTEPGGKYLTIVYSDLITVAAGRGGYGEYYLSSVTTSDGRSATYAYQGSSALISGTYYYSYRLAQVSYSGTYAASYTYVTLAPQDSGHLFGIFALSQAIDGRAEGLSNIKYTYFSGSGDPFGAVQTVSEGSSNTLICTLSLVGGNAQTPEVIFPDGSFFKYNVNAGGLLASVTNSLNNSESYAYTSGTGTWTTTVTDANGHSTATTRTTTGKLVSVTVRPTN